MLTEGTRFLGQRKGTLLFTGRSNEHRHVCVSSPGHQTHRGNTVHEGAWLHTQWVWVQKGNPELKEAWSFITAVYMPVAAPEGDTTSVFQDVRQTFSLFQRGALSLFSVSFLCTHTQCLCLRDVHECEREPWEGLTRQSYHGCKQEKLAFEPVGRWVEMEAISRKRFSYESLAAHSSGA